jgi:beta-galactosidase
VPNNIFTFDPNRPRNTFSLNGEWQITGSDEIIIPATFPSTIPVPAVVEMAQPPYDWQKFDYHWYRTSFLIEHLPDKQNVFLKISQSMFGTEVWLNGHHLGGTISCYTSHEYLLNEFLKHDGVNELIVRVGAKFTLPPESAVGRDQEKEIYTPGIWGDVKLVCVGGARVKLVQVIPHIDSSTAEVRAWIENLASEEQSLIVSANIIEKTSRLSSSDIHEMQVNLASQSTEQVTFHISIQNMELWSHETPFLYEVEITVRNDTANLDLSQTVFGMRGFQIIGSDFYLNGKKILLRGGNIAFHRFLSDKQRKLLPWDVRWIKKAFIDIPKEHNFNFFRNHLGQMYNKWYDIADEYGMLIQNEWQFWGVTGSDTQIQKEFTEWLHDNWNHPSIIIWDPLNESTDETVQREIVPEMKQLDPTRPWESVDFREDHPYIYSLGMVMNNRGFGFTRSLDELEHLPVPSMVNEFLWWWLNDKWEPTVLTKDILKRWMGRNYTKEDVISHQSFLAQELIELFRRLRVKAIQPFVYISNNDGPTAHWFLGDIKDLKPKPVLAAIKNAFAPFGISIELWDRHFFVNERRTIRIFVFNDSTVSLSGIVTIGISLRDGKWISKKEIPVSVDYVSDDVLTTEVLFPEQPGDYVVRAELKQNSVLSAVSSKIAHVFEAPRMQVVKRKTIVFDPSQEINRYLSDINIPFNTFEEEIDGSITTIIIHGNVFSNHIYTKQRNAISHIVKSGGTLVLIEPEFRVVGKVKYTIVDGVDLNIAHRADLDKGGYDSYVFAEDEAHPLWKNLTKEHLKFFNGAYGGEIVSQCDVDFSIPSKRLASCGMDLHVTAASEVDYGKGKIVLFRLQLRGRLTASSDHSALYARRIDPVAQQLLLNILEY